MKIGSITIPGFEWADREPSNYYCSDGISVTINKLILKLTVANFP